MILTVEELRTLLPDLTDADEALELKLRGLTQLVKGLTCNTFERYRDPATGEIAWPDDLKLGVAGLVRWDAANADRVGVASETLSRHSVTYSQVSGTDSKGGYPAALMGFLEPYKRARF